jgi:hypothetical protein
MRIKDPYPSEPTIYRGTSFLIKQVWDTYYLFDTKYCLLLKQDGIVIFDMKKSYPNGTEEVFIFKERCQIDNKDLCKLETYIDRNEDGTILLSSREKTTKAIDRYLNLLVFS